MLTTKSAAQVQSVCVYSSILRLNKSPPQVLHLTTATTPILLSSSPLSARQVFCVQSHCFHLFSHVSISQPAYLPYLDLHILMFYYHTQNLYPLSYNSTINTFFALPLQGSNHFPSYTYSSCIFLSSILLGLQGIKLFFPLYY